jgi:hypothetical protein
LRARKEWTNALNLQLSTLVSECRIFQHFQLHCSHCFYLYHGRNMNQEHVQYLAMAPLLHQSQQNSVVSVTKCYYSITRNLSSPLEMAPSPHQSQQNSVVSDLVLLLNI